MASTLTVDNIVGATSSDKIHIPGHVIQTVSSTLTSTVSSTGTSIVDTGLTATITPSSTSSKIYVNGYITIGTQAYFVYCWLVRGSTQIFKGDTASNRPTVTITTSGEGGVAQDVYAMHPLPFSYLDSPNTTSATTYKIQIRQYGTQAWYVNRTHSDRDNADYEPRGASVITLQEIAQ